MRKLFSLLIAALLISAIGALQSPIPVRAGSGSLYFTPSYVSFPSQTVGTKSTPVNVTIKNSGSVNVTLARLGISGDFKLRVGDCTAGRILIPGETCVFMVVFAPLSIAYKTGKVTIPSDAANPLYTITLSGSGTGTNLLLSPNFDLPLVKPMPWRDGPRALSVTDRLDCSVWVSPMCSVRLRGNSGNTAQIISQARARVGEVGDKYAFILSSKSSAIPVAGQYSLEVTFLNTYNQVVGRKVVNFKTGTHNWQTLVGNITAFRQYTWIVFRFTLKKTGGVAWFDNAILVKIP